MMKRDNRISNKQIKALLVSTIVGVGILSLPNKMASVSERDGWIPIIISGLIVSIGVIVIVKLFELYPDKDFFQVGDEILGKWIFNIFLIILLSYLMTLMSSVVRSLGEILKAFLLDITPIEILIMVFILATTYIARCEINVIGRAAYHIYPIALGFIILLLIVSLPNIDISNMLPIFRSNLNELPRGIKDGLFSYLGFEVLLFALPYSENKKGVLKDSLLGIGIVIAMYTIIFVLCLSHYGLDHLQRQTFPTISIIKEVDFPGFFIENLDGLVVSIWVMVIFGTVGPIYYSSGKVLAKLLGTKDHKLFILPMIPIVYVISLIPENIQELNEGLDGFVNYTGLISVFLLPILLYTIGYIKKRRKINEKN